MKVKLYILNTNEEYEYRDFYIDVTQIQGFYMPDLEPGDDLSINLIISGHLFNVKQEPHLLAYLSKRFGIK